MKGEIAKIYRRTKFKDLLLKNQRANFNQTWHNRGDNNEKKENISTNYKSLKNHRANLNQPWLKAFLGEKGFKFIQMKDPSLFRGEIIRK